MKDYNNFINEAHFSNLERDLGYGIMTNMVNILKCWNFEIKDVEIFANLFGIPITIITAMNPKRELSKLLNGLTLKNIERGIIVVYGKKELPLKHGDFNNDLTFNNVKIFNIHPEYIQGGKKEFRLNRKKVTIENAKLIIRAHKAKNIKNIIKSAKTAPQTKELNDVYEEFGINFRYIDKRLIDNVEKLAQEIVNLRKKKED